MNETDALRIMASVGNCNLLAVDTIMFLRCTPTTNAKSASCKSCAAPGRFSRAGLVGCSSHGGFDISQMVKIAIIGKSRLIQGNERSFMFNKLRAGSGEFDMDKQLDDSEISDYERGEPSTRRTPVQGGVPENRGEFSSPLAVSIRNLGLSIKSERGEVPVLMDCSLNVPEGQLWMLLGPNGCGKSTLLKAMAGLLKPNRGKMFVIGPRSFVFQNPDHQVVMPTAEADVAFGLGRFNLSIDEVRERVHKSLQAVGMDKYAQRPVQTLSGGQKQRIAIAGALAESSRLLLLDELTTFLDRGDQIGVLEAVRKVVGVTQKVTALWVTHRLEELEFADGAAYMENGRVVVSGSVADVEAYIRRKKDEYFTEQESIR